MLLTKKWMVANDTCAAGIAFAIRNQLIGFPLNKLDTIVGDYCGYVHWLQGRLISNANASLAKKPIETESIIDGHRVLHRVGTNGYETWTTYDAHDNMIHYKAGSGHEVWYRFDAAGNRTYEKSGIHGEEKWTTYDDQNRVVHFKCGDGFENWIEYDRDVERYSNTYGYVTTKTSKDGNVIKFESSLDGEGFVRVYNDDGRIIHHKDESGFEYWVTFGDRVEHYRDNADGVHEIEFDMVGNIISGDGGDDNTDAGEYSDGKTPTTFYDNGQLKSIGTCVFPLIGDLLNV